MSDRTSSVSSREDRLAAKLRENLHRRKAQARAMDAECRSDPGHHAADASRPVDESRQAESDGALSKPPVNG